MFHKDDVVQPCGKLKKVVDFLASADKETLRLLSSFFTGEAKGPTDAKRMQKPLVIKNVYLKDLTIEVELTKNYLWEERESYFEKVEVPTEGDASI